jgi:hypothetical protein
MLVIAVVLITCGVFGGKKANVTNTSITNITGIENPYDGIFTAKGFSTGNVNTRIGEDSGSNITTGVKNTFIGVLSGKNNTIPVYIEYGGFLKYKKNGKVSKLKIDKVKSGF